MQGNLGSPFEKHRFSEDTQTPLNRREKKRTILNMVVRGKS